jgi:hypothetical protein
MKVLLLVVLAVVAVSAVLPPLAQAEYENEFTEYVMTQQKQYTADEFFYRFGVWRRAYDMIREHNAAGKSWQMGVNQFTDMTPEEFSAWVNRGAFPPAVPSNAVPFEANPMFDPPESIDWIAKGAVTPVKDQAACGSCWAFSTVGAIEGWWQINHGGKLQDFSEQQLVDCSKDVCYGCQGGWPYKATEYVTRKGICAEGDYKYTGRDGTCKDAQCTPIIKPGQLSKYLNISGEDNILAALNNGPISVLVEADRSAFQYYRSGILDDPSCGTSIDHAITLTGYGTEGGKAYWNIKNSWGKGWGAQGYIRFVRNKNQCGIANGAVQPDPSV